jgi:starch synthase (maltosyl-transferring)
VVGRFGISDVAPVVGSLVSGEFPARAVAGERVPVSATVFREGHDAVGATVVVRDPTGTRRETLRMASVGRGTDRWVADVVADAPGLWSFTIEAWGDPLGTWRHAVTAKLAAGQTAAELANDYATGARLLEKLARQVPAAERPSCRAAATALLDVRLGVDERAERALAAPVQELAYRYPLRDQVTRSGQYRIRVDRPRALYGSWYEFFPRSIGAQLSDDPRTPARPLRHGTLKDATEHLDYVASLGFDVVYLPPVHPIGEINRKGPNNSLDAAEWDVGSPWAIGSRYGGHDTLHPELGTMADFTAFVRRARELGMEVALDFALQAAPDHPWVTAHPEWFTTLPDGSIAYAENPPKKYQDIYPINFDLDPDGLHAECLRILNLWIDAGVSIFRVDNPHTKPINFWHRLLGEMRKTHPDVLFLAEAFTRPPMMAELAKVGFHQSYTYFTWRNTKAEIESYALELRDSAAYMRPNFFVNTPDILHAYLAYGGPAAFAIRAVLAATLSPSWGVYSGYEFFEHRPVAADSEEYLDSEKYQLRPRDFSEVLVSGRSLAPLIAALNAIRRAHPALQQLRNLRFHHVDNDQITAFSKYDVDTGDTVLVVCTVNPHIAQEGTVSLDLDALGIDGNGGCVVRDLLSGTDYQWGAHNYVRLDPYVRVAHVFQVAARIP